MKNKFITVLCLQIGLLWTYTLCGQVVGNLKGIIIDADSEEPLIGATVQLLLGPGQQATGTTTDMHGYYRIEQIDIGRYQVIVTYLGYEPIYLANIEIGSGKEVQLDFKMQESVEELEEVVVTVKLEKGQVINEMSSISTRTFSLEEATRYSGGRNDVSKLVSAYAGVSNSNDSRNDIVIRGNSPTGVLWRMEGIPIPNPNHFATLGTTGGPVSALNTNLLKDSDFLTSAFSAEYGNALSGVFDVGLRSGNKDQYEFTAQIAAFSGMEFMVEGPLSKKKNSSFLISGRYAFTSVANKIGLDIGTMAIPDYSDITFKIDFGKGHLGKFSIFGLWGQSDIAFLAAEIDQDDLFFESDADSRAASSIGVFGVKHSILLNKNSYLRTVVSVSRASNNFDQDRYIDTTLTQKYLNTGVRDQTDRIVANSYYNIKHGAQHVSRVGLLATNLLLNSIVDDRRGADIDGDGILEFVKVRDVNESLITLEPYLQHKWRTGKNTTLHLGVHGQYSDLNTEWSVEPRLSAVFDLTPRSTVQLGYGLHSQVQPLPVLFFRTQTAGGLQAINRNLSSSKAHHLVAAYSYTLFKDWELKLEAYYQALFNIPVDNTPSSFSILNAGADFVFPDVGELENSGTGRNYGLELTLEKYFSEGYYALMTGSLFQSKYTPSDGVERNTAFNNTFVYNILGGKEWHWGDKKRVSVDFKFTNAGGRYFTPVDLPASRVAQREILDQSQAFTQRYPSYLRFDFKVGIKIFSHKKFSQQFFLDFQNVTNRQNVFVDRYNRATGQINTIYQIGFFPDVLYRLRF